MTNNIEHLCNLYTPFSKMSVHGFCPFSNGIIIIIIIYTHMHTHIQILCYIFGLQIFFSRSTIHNFILFTMSFTEQTFWILLNFCWTFWTLLKFVLWPEIWSILLNVPWTPENVFYFVGWNVVDMSITMIVLFSSIFLTFFCLLVLSSRVLKSSTIIVDLPCSLLGSINFLFHVFWGTHI